MTENLKDMQSAFFSHMDFYNIGAQEVIAVAVSGGPDSMALCGLLSKWGKLKIHALTVDHRLRSNSTQEAQTVTKWLKPYNNIHHTILTWNHSGAPQSRLQETARAARYDLLSAYMKENKIRHLFLGHHQDDQAETFLFRLAKGSGLDGLAGMAAHQESEYGIVLCRPLLNFEKSELVKYCETEEIDFCHDPSNDSERFARVRLRQSFDVLENEGLTSKRLATTALRLARARKALEELSGKIYKNNILKSETSQIVLNCDFLKNQPEEIVLRVLKHAIDHIRSGQPYALRLERLENLCVDMMKPEGFRKRTLSGVVFERNDKTGKITLTRERVR